MAVPALAQLEPRRVVAGDSWQWQRTFGDFAIADGWVLSYAINGATALAWSVSWISNDGTTFTIEIPPATTAALEPGSYELTAILTGSAAGTGESNGMRVALSLPRLVVLPDPTTAEAGDRVSWAARTLPVVEAALAGRLSDDMQNYQINGKAVSMIPVAELFLIRRRIRGELWRENHPGKSGPVRLVSFHA